MILANNLLKKVRNLTNLNDVVAKLLEGFSLDKDVKGEILVITFAPNETKIISHGLGAIPQYRLILRQTGNAVITDVNTNWTDKSIGLLNNSTIAVTITLKLMPR